MTPLLLHSLGQAWPVAREVFEALSLHLFLLCALAAVPLFVLARERIYPHVMLPGLILVPCVLSPLLLVVPESLALVLTLDFAIVLLAVVDLVSLPRQQDWSAKRDLQRVTSLNKRHPVELTVLHERATKHRLQAWVRDDIPQEFEATPPEMTFQLAGRCRAQFQYRLTPRSRGAFSMNAVHLRVASRWKIWKRQYSCPVQSTVHVYPNMVQLAEYALLARTNRLSLIGLRRTRNIGQDHDFERLRDYTTDDNHKHIDWRATARRNRLTVKQYQTSQSQRIVFLLDCGRMMNNTASGLSLLDHALNAMLMLSYVALRQGDSVGLLCFADRIHNSVPVRGGMSQMNQLLHASFDRFPQLVESRYDLAFLHLATRFRKRALVVLISNVIDEVNSFQVNRYLRAQVGRHLPLGVLLRDHRLFDAAEAEQPTGHQLFRAAAAAEILNWRREVLADLEHQGVLTLDVFPEAMTTALVNQYLDVKARHLL
ncbi:MAG: DUF58 domain-containing protein [Planctomycetota bacterium]